jgi:hypothetical protein
MVYGSMVYGLWSMMVNQGGTDTTTVNTPPAVLETYFRCDYML